MRKNSIREQYALSIFGHIFMLFCGVASLIVLIACLIQWENEIFEILFAIGMIIVFVVFVFLGLKSFADLLKDWKLVKNNVFVSVVGKVVGYKKNEDFDTGKQINTQPIIKILETEETIILYTAEQLVVGKTYQFRYLKHSKIAEIINMQNEQ